jgi:hypothetical protein
VSATVTWDGIPSGINKLRLGMFDIPLNGHIRKLKYFPKRLSDSELQSLTA